MFHQECITQWFYKKLEGPLCRRSFEEDLKALREERKSEPVSDEEQEDGDELAGDIGENEIE